MSNTARAEADAVREIVLAGLPPAQVLHLEGQTFVALRDASGAQKLEKIEDEKERRPLFLEAEPVFRSRESFIHYVERFRVPDSLLFGTLDTGQIVAELDYHGPTGGAAHRHHTARLNLQHSPEWLAWVGANRKPIGQVPFAEFLEDRIADIAEPAGGVILDACTNLIARKDVAFRSTVRLQNGASSLEFTERVEQEDRKGSLRVPETFTLHLRPYTHAERVPVNARLRFRIQEGKLSFVFVLDRLEETLEEAFRREVEAVEQALGAVVLWGAV